MAYIDFEEAPVRKPYLPGGNSLCQWLADFRDDGSWVGECDWSLRLLCCIRRCPRVDNDQCEILGRKNCALKLDDLVRNGMSDCGMWRQHHSRRMKRASRKVYKALAFACVHSDHPIPSSAALHPDYHHAVLYLNHSSSLFKCVRRARRPPTSRHCSMRSIPIPSLRSIHPLHQWLGLVFWNWVSMFTNRQSDWYHTGLLNNVVLVWHTQPSEELHERRDDFHEEAAKCLHKHSDGMEVELYWNRSAGQRYAPRALFLTSVARLQANVDVMSCSGL